MSVYAVRNTGHFLLFILCTLPLFYLFFTLSGCSRQVFFERPESYWIWAGITAPDSLQKESLYIYQGTLTKKSEEITFKRQGLYPFPSKSKELYLVFRVEVLDFSPRFINTIISYIDEWEHKGNTVRGVQLDFDSPTAKLLQYSDFLENFRSRLPKNYRLSITGLGDWLFAADSKALPQVGSMVDEVVFQLYQGRKPFHDKTNYLIKLNQLKFHYKVGLLRDDHCEIAVSSALAENPFYLGNIYFLQL